MQSRHIELLFPWTAHFHVESYGNITPTRRKTPLACQSRHVPEMVFTYHCHRDLFFFLFLFIFFQLVSVSVHFWRLTLATAPARIPFSLLPLSFYLLASIFSLSTSVAVALMNDLGPSTFEGGMTCGLVTLACLTPPPCLRLTVIVSSITKFKIRFSYCSSLRTPAPASVPLAEKERTGEPKPITIFLRCRPFRGRPVAVRPSPLHNRSFGRASNKYWRGFFCRA